MIISDSTFSDADEDYDGWNVSGWNGNTETPRRFGNRQSSFFVFGENAVENLQWLAQGGRRPVTNENITSLIALIPAVKQFVEQCDMYAEHVQATTKEMLISR